MTREEIIKGLKSVKEELHKILTNPYAWVYQPIDEAIKALEQESKILNTLNFAIDASNGDTNYFVGFRNGLRYSKSLIDGEEPQFERCAEQEPCEDCISREQLVRELNAQMAVGAITKEVAIDMLEHLPPVTPKPKTDVLDKIRAEIEEVQTYKMFEGEDTVYVERNDVFKIIGKYKAEKE